MISRSSAAALSVVAAMAAEATTFNFDSLNPGDPANLTAQAGIHFKPAVFAPDLDGDGIEIPGTDHWRVDSNAPPILVGDPQAFGGGPAPTPSLALDAFFQPVMVMFSSPSRIQNFSVTLDGNTFGSVLDALFLDDAGKILLSVPVDQTKPYFRLFAGPLEGVSSVVLPAGAFYDKLTVPEANPFALWMAAGLVGVWEIARRNGKRA